MAHEQIGLPPQQGPEQEPDLNAVREQVRAGGVEKRDLADALSEPGGFHDAHMVNPAAHPGEEVHAGPSLDEIRDAAARVMDEHK